MTKSIIKNYSSLFLAAVLVAGIIAAFSPSFTMMEAQGQQGYGIDNYEKKVKVEKIKCDNQNFNLDILNPEIIPEITNYLMEFQETKNPNDNKRIIDDNIILICTNYNDPVKFPVTQPGQTERNQ
jgi:hypothetical protein